MLLFLYTSIFVCLLSFACVPGRTVPLDLKLFVERSLVTVGQNEFGRRRNKRHIGSHEKRHIRRHIGRHDKRHIGRHS